MQTEDTITILGHRNPDADSICAAIAYEAFQHSKGNTHYMAARCGNSNNRIDAILNRFNVPLPKFVGDVTPRVRHIMQTKIYTIGRTSTCAEALEMIETHDVTSLPVVDETGKLEGIVSSFELGEYFIPSAQTGATRRVNTSLNNIVKSLKGEVIHLHEPDTTEELLVRIGAMSRGALTEIFEDDNNQGPKNSILIVGDRPMFLNHVIEHGVRLVVLVGDNAKTIEGPSAEKTAKNLHEELTEDMLALAKKNGVSIVTSPHDIASTAILIRAATLLNPMIRGRMITFSADDTLHNVRKRIAPGSSNTYLVTGEDGKLEGLFTNSDILKPKQRKIALVDHNELGQAVKGAAEADIVEIIDHHRLNNPPTGGPILFYNDTVGSTCTLIANFYKQARMQPTPSIAGVMMGGIISDTLHLQGPTTTRRDREILTWLEGIAGITGAELAEMIFSAGSILAQGSAKKAITADCKHYTHESYRYSVAQIEETGLDEFWKQESDLKEALEAYRKKERLLFSLLLVTDVHTQNSLMIAVGEKAFLQQISYPTVKLDYVFDLPSIVSRKKQLIPYVGEILKRVF